MDKPSKEDKADLQTPFLPLRTVLVKEPGHFGAAWGSHQANQEQLKEAQGSTEQVVAQAEPRNHPCLHHHVPSRAHRRRRGMLETAADGLELRAGSFKRRMNTENVVKAFEPNREGSTGVT